MGGTTYELMASYWPTPQANADNPVVAHRGVAVPASGAHLKRLDLMPAMTSQVMALFHPSRMIGL